MHLEIKLLHDLAPAGLLTEEQDLVVARIEDGAGDLEAGRENRGRVRRRLT